MVAIGSSLKHGSLMKVHGVILAAGEDADLLASLDDDVEGAVREAGIDLSPGEINALEDVVYGRENALLGTESERMSELWREIVRANTGDSGEKKASR